MCGKPRPLPLKWDRLWGVIYTASSSQDQDQPGFALNLPTAWLIPLSCPVPYLPTSLFGTHFLKNSLAQTSSPRGQCAGIQPKKETPELCPKGVTISTEAGTKAQPGP